MLDWSIDAGETWTTAETLVVNDPVQRTFALSAELPAGVAIAPFLQARVGFSSVSDWTPVLTGVWADYAVLDAPPRRHRWTFAVVARDGSIQRDGSLAALDGNAQSAALWQSWADNQTVSFRDLDYDANPTERQIRVIAIEESIPKPSDAGHWGTSTIHLQLQEL